jgi:site-specific recombinase XerD
MTMQQPLPPLQERIVAEIERTVSAGEAVVAARTMRMLATYAGPGECAFLALSAHDLEQMFVKRGYRDTTVRRILSTLLRIYGVAVAWNLISENPAAAVRRPKMIPNYTDFNIDSSLVDIVIEHCSTAVELRGTRRIAFRTLLKLAFVYVVSSGAFVAELPKIRCGDLSSDGLVVGGNSRKRKLFLSSDALTSLQNYLSIRSSGILPPDGAPLFVTEAGKPTYVKLVWKLVNKVIKEAGAAELGLTPAKLQRASVKFVADTDVGWLAAASFGGYRSMPKLHLRPYTAGELAKIIDRFHPMSSDRGAPRELI